MAWGRDRYERHEIPNIDGIDWSELRCDKCDCTERVVPSDGPVPCRVLLIGERPGLDEMERQQRPFTGRTGRELNENYLELAGLSRDEVHFCNLVQCGSAKGQVPGKDLIESCSSTFLPAIIESVRPTFIVPMGSTACSIFDRIILKMHHGMPLRRKLFGKEYWVIPQLHPAGGLRDTKQMTHMIEDWTRLGSIISGEYRIIRDEYKGSTDYKFVTGGKAVTDYILSGLETDQKWLSYAGLDTETDEGEVWCITISVRPGSGIMFLASDTEAVEALKNLQKRFHWFIHNAMFDIKKLRNMDVGIDNYTCTMQGAYHRGNIPQGLKQGAWRLLGIEMTEYEDVVIPRSREKLNEWWDEAIGYLSETDVTVTERFGAVREVKPKVIRGRMLKWATRILGQSCKPNFSMDKYLAKLDEADRQFIQDAPKDIEGLLEWLEIHDVTVEIPEPKPVKVLKPEISESKFLKRMIAISKHLAKGAETYNPWKKWAVITETAGITPDDVARLVQVLGPPPQPSIIHVPMESDPGKGIVGAIEYACRDACTVLRYGLKLRSQERMIRKSRSMVTG